jgi:hypothetical protein
MKLSPLVTRLAVPVIVTPLGGGMLVGPLVAGALRSLTGGYDEPLLVAAGCLLFACALFVTFVLGPEWCAARAGAADRAASPDTQNRLEHSDASVSV